VHVTVANKSLQMSGSSDVRGAEGCGNGGNIGNGNGGCMGGASGAGGERAGRLAFSWEINVTGEAASMANLLALAPVWSLKSDPVRKL